MFEGLLLPWQQIYHLGFYSILEELLKFLVNFTLLKYVKSQRSYGFLITKELLFGFQILIWLTILSFLHKNVENSLISNHVLEMSVKLKSQCVRFKKQHCFALVVLN